VNKSTLQFKIYPVLNRQGVRYIVKENKMFGKYLAYTEGDNFTKTYREDATSWSSPDKVVRCLSKAFGDRFTIVDNYL